METVMRGALVRPLSVSRCARLLESAMGYTTDLDFRSIFESSPSSSLVLAPDLTVVGATDAYLREAMASRAELLGRNVFDVVSETADDDSSTLIADLRASIGRVMASRRSDSTAIRKCGFRTELEGSELYDRYCRYVNTPILDTRGDVVCILHCVEDVTEVIWLKEREAVARERCLRSEEFNRHLSEARAAAEAASAAKSDFLSSMSHELRTPLNAILGFAQLLDRDRKEVLSDRQRERVSRILSGGRHLVRLIDDILDLSRIEAGGLSMSIEPLRVPELLADIRTILEPMAARHGMQLVIERSLGEPPMIAADRTRFSQILMNFGTNAIKYNRPSGTVTFAVSTPRPGSIRVTVQDTGIGIPADKQHRLFQPFQRAGQEVGPIEGTGIGLVIAKRLAERMDGDVGFRSVAGVGSAFWVDVPVAQCEANSTGMLHTDAPPIALEIVRAPFVQDRRHRSGIVALSTAHRRDEPRQDDDDALDGRVAGAKS